MTNILASGILRSIGGIVLAVAILLAMVTIHEFGHYVAGKALGFKINEFAVGFGPAIFKKRSKKTGELFALRCIPLGGYCAFDGEDEYEDETDENAVKKEEETDEEEPFSEYPNANEKTQNDGGMSATNDENVAVDASKEHEKKTKKEETEYPEPKGERFNDQPPWKRIIVLIAGATMNYLLALLLLLIMFGCYGSIHSYVAYVGEGAPPITSETMLSANDIVLSINDKDIYMSTDYVDILSGKKAGESVRVEILRKEENGWQTKTLDIVLSVDCNFKNMTDLAPAYQALGLDSQNYVFGGILVKESFFDTIGSAFVYSWKIGGTVLRSLGELLTGKMAITSMGGPVTTIQVTSQAATMSVYSFLNIAAFIGVNLAVFNLLPIPALDGCKVIFCIIEWIRKKPVNRKVETMIHFIGIIALFGFAILVDVLHFIL
ncbi:MAG: RIP metalloprotease [Clostridia bacterium]|nr:RIP metalloprotease [Clostridia bacterium]